MILIEPGYTAVPPSSKTLNFNFLGDLAGLGRGVLRERGLGTGAVDETGESHYTGEKNKGSHLQQVLSHLCEGSLVTLTKYSR